MSGFLPAGTAQVVPLNAIPAQLCHVMLANRSCQLRVYGREFEAPLYTNVRVKHSNVFIDVFIENQLVIGGVIGLHANRIVRDAYLGFPGDLAFYDTQGTDDPRWDGLGTRWILCWIPPS
jgi:hypothetical protein